MKLYHFAIVRIAFFYILGIIIAHNITIDNSIVITLLSASIIGLFFTFIRSNKQLFQNSLFGIFTFLTVFFSGIFNYHIHQEKNYANHYLHHTKSHTYSTVQIRLKNKLKASEKYERYKITIEKSGNIDVFGTALLYVKKDKNDAVLNIGDSFLLNASFQTIKPPLNPYQFDYSNYLAKKNIHLQAFVDKNQLELIQKTSSSIFIQIAQFRERIKKVLLKNGFNSEETAIINALLLGQREDISQEVYASYIDAGAVHILAVSGLHIGIITWVLGYIFSPLSYSKYGRLAKLIIILLLLWAFALLSGFSPSVVRASTMFSFITFALHRKKTTNVFATLIASAFLILLIQPDFLLETGFQLSYIAVFSIVWIHPLLFNIWQPKYIAAKFFWELFSVSIAAQIGILPISLFYFHQFPGLFFLSNLIIVPFLGMILILGIITILLSLLNILPAILVNVYAFFIRLMNNFIAWIAQQESFLWKEIYFDWKLLLLFYLIIICSILYLKNKRVNKLIIVLTAVLCIQLSMGYNKFNLSNTNKFLIFHTSRNTMIGYQKKDSLILYTNNKRINIEKNTFISDYKTATQVRKTNTTALKNIFQIGEKKVLIIDSLGIYNIPELPVNYVVLTNSPKINLNRLINLYKPELIIADGSNYKNMVALWKATCKKEKFPFHYTGEKGTFILDF